MDTETPIAQKRRFKNGIFAALDICAEKRALQNAHRSLHRCRAESPIAVPDDAENARLADGQEKSRNFDEQNY